MFPEEGSSENQHSSKINFSASTQHTTFPSLCLGFGFLSFEDEDSVERCVSEHFVNLSGKQVH